MYITSQTMSLIPAPSANLAAAAACVQVESVEMEAKKPYVIAIIVQMTYAGLFIIGKAAFDQGMNTFVFIFYRQAASSLLLLPIAFLLERKNAPPVSFWLLLKLFLYALIGNTFPLNVYSASMKFTSATLASATSNTLPVATFCWALLFRKEVVKLRSLSGIAKLAGVVLCLAGVFVIALFPGPALSPVNHHHAFAAHTSNAPRRVQWIKGTFLMVLANMTMSLWIVIQRPGFLHSLYTITQWGYAVGCLKAGVLKEYPNKMLVTLSQCVFGTVQSFVVAVAAERDFSKWKLRLDVSLLGILYSGFVVNGLSYYLQAWCVEKKGPVFLAVWTPLCLVFTILCSTFFLGEIVHLGSIVAGILLVGGLYGVLWGKNKENKIVPCKEENMIDGVQNEQDHKETKEKEQIREVEEEATLAGTVEQV